MENFNNLSEKEQMEFLRYSVNKNTYQLLDNEFFKKEMDLISNTPLDTYMKSDKLLKDTINFTLELTKNEKDITIIYRTLSDYQYYHFISQMVMYLMNEDDYIDKNVLYKYSEYCELQTSYDASIVISMISLVLKNNDIQNADLFELSRHWIKTIQPKFKDIRDLIDKRLSSL